MTAPNTRDAKLASFIDDLWQPTPAMLWLERAGTIAKRLNEQSQEDAGSAQQAPSQAERMHRHG